jgi:mRNA interferase MazF
MGKAVPAPSPPARGDLYWIDASPGHGSGEPHPHLVLQEDVFNRSRIRTVIACALTSNVGRAREPGNVLLELGEGNLPRRSVIVVSQISAFDKSALGAYIGRLSEERVEQALDGLRFQQASFFTRS